MILFHNYKFKGAFLVPNYICVILVGIPMFLLEVGLGQYLNTGGIAIWNLVPIFKGIYIQNDNKI